MERKPSDDYTEQIKRLRARLELSQVALSELLGVSFATVNRWENGKTKPNQLSWNRLLEIDREEEIKGAIREAGEMTRPRPDLIDFTAEPAIVQSLIEGERLSFGHLANPAFATEIASIDPLPHQRIAVYERMLNQVRLRVLLADDAGAGKTIMTGLYVREMLSRRQIKRVLIVPPAGLVGNWQREMQVLFNMPFSVIIGNNGKTSNPFASATSDRVVVSMDSLRQPVLFGRLGEKNTRPYDLVVFDEAHKLSCNRDSNFKVKRTDRYKLAEALAGVHSAESGWQLPWRAQHLLLLTATPHMGHDYPYYALWRLLEPEVLATYDAFTSFPAKRRHRYFIRRTKEEMVKFDGSPLYPKRQCDTLGYELAQGEVSEQTLYDRTTEYLRHVYNKAKVLNHSAARLAMSVFQRRSASSTYALLCSFERRIEKLDRIITDIRNGDLTIEQLGTLQRRLRDDDDVFESMTADEESGEDGHEMNEAGEIRLLAGVIAESLDELQAERAQVLGLRELAQQVYGSGSESKFEKLRDVINDPKYATEKLLIFTEHKDTLEFLVRRLGGMGFTGRIAQIHGGMHYTKRQAQIEKFRRSDNDGGARFMICTDAAAEGVNLQFCWRMINYDVPWNPARLEQRMGRIHRYGQLHDPVIILNLVALSTREGRVIKTLLDKLEKIRKELRSDKVFDSIGRIFSDVSIKDYMESALEDGADAVAAKLEGQLTKEQVKALEDHERRLYGDGGDVKRELPRLRESMESEVFYKLLPGYVRSFIQNAAPLVQIGIAGDLGDRFSFVPKTKGATDTLLQVLEQYPTRQARYLSVIRPRDRDSCVWVHPGEPVFDEFRKLVRSKLGADALRGAVFVDPKTAKPYLFHLARLSMLRRADPEFKEFAQEELVESRLVGLRQSEGADLHVCPVEHLLLLRGGRGLPPEAQTVAVEAEAQRDQAKAYLSERVCRTMALDRRKIMLNVLPDRETSVKRGYDFQEAELATVRARLTRKARAGNKAAARELSRIKEQQQELSRRRGQGLALIRREPELLVAGAIKFLTHALVVPSGDSADVARQRADVEKIAMLLIQAYEEAEGASVTCVHTPELARKAGLPDHPGFDILSVRPDGDSRCIEAKGRAQSGEIEITDNEWARACNLRQKYWIYAVFHCASPTPQMVRIQDPFEKLLVRPFTKSQRLHKTINVPNQRGGVRVGYSQVMEAGEQ